MKNKNSCLTLLSLMYFSAVFCQTNEAESDCSLELVKNKFHCLTDNKAFKEFHNKQIIMFGELHGINEVADYLSSVLAYFSTKQKTILAIELPEDYVSEFNKNRDVEQLKKVFETSKMNDGRLGAAWFRLLSNLADKKM